MHIFKTNIDIDKNEAKNFRLQNEIAFPSVVSGDKGFVFFHSGFNTFYGWDGTSWIDFAGAGSYTLPTATTTILGGVKIDGTTVTIDGAGVISASTASTGLEAVDEGNGNGYRLVGMNPDNYGPIGFGSVDFSQNTASIVFGARGLYGLNIGNDNTQSTTAYYQVTVGDTNVTSNHYNWGIGTGNIVSGYASFGFGYQNQTLDHYSFNAGAWNVGTNRFQGMFGFDNRAKDYGTFVVGRGNTDYTAAGGTNAADTRLFIVGNGTLGAGTPATVTQRNDAMVVYYDGSVTMPTASIADINGRGNIAVPTVEWTNDKYLPKYLVNATVTGTYNIDWDFDTLRLTMTGATVFSDINLPTSGVNTKVLTIYMNGNFTPTWPAGWTTYVTGTYDGTVLNQIVVEFISTGVYWVTINRAD